MNYNLEDYNYLWDGTEAGWLLVRSKDKSNKYQIFNVYKQVILLVEDSEKQAAVCARLLELGCCVRDGIPKEEFDVSNIKGSIDGNTKLDGGPQDA